MADLHDSTEHYLSTIYEIQEEDIKVKRARIAERLNISAPSVTEHVQRMEKQGLVKVTEDNAVELTSEGKQKATSVVRRHRLAERLLVDVIGLDWESAHHEADRWEHVISDEVEVKLVKLLNNPSMCPHGNPIPNPDGSQNAEAKEALKNSIRLNDAKENSKVKILRIGESIEMDPLSLNFVYINQLVPGSVVEVKDLGEDEVNIISPEGNKISISKGISHAIFVEMV